MKNTLLITMMLLFCSLTIMAQEVPTGMKYQAVARDLDGQVLANQPISLQVALVAKSDSKTYQYTEQHFAVTNKLGLFNLTIGEGHVVEGNFNQIPWSTGEVWMELSIDIKGGADFVLIHTNKLLAVPYAFHAATAGELSSDGQIKIGAKAWEVLGNEGTSSDEHFIGTIDQKDLVFKTGSEERMRINAEGTIMMPLVEIDFAHIGVLSATEVDVVNDLKIGGELNVAGLANFQGLAQVEGHFDALQTAHVGTDLDVNNNVYVGHDLDVTNDTRIGHDLDVGKDARIVNDLDVGKNGTIGVDLSVGKDASIGNDLSVTNNTETGHDLDVGNDGRIVNDLDVGHDINVGNDLGIGNDLDVGGTGTFNHMVVQNNASINTIGGSTTIGGPTTINNTLGVANSVNLNTTSGTTAIEGATTINNTLSTGSTSVNGTLGVSSTVNLNTTGGTTTIGGATTIHGATTINNTLNTGSTSVNGTLGVSSTVNLNTTGGTTTIGGATTIQGATTINNTLNSGSAGINGTLGVSGAVSLNNTNGATTIKGATNIINTLTAKATTVNGVLTTNGTSALNGQVTIAAGLAGDQGNKAAYPLRVQGSAQGIAVQVNGGTPNSGNNFITFFNSANAAVGRIEGQTLGELQNSFDYVYETTFFVLDETLILAHAAAALASVPPDAAEAAVGAAEGAVLIAHYATWASHEHSEVGVAFESGGADYAEWLEKFSDEETFSFGDIVGVKGGKISKRMTNPNFYMVVSKSPIVLGNMPPAGREEKFEKIAFMGQVPVKVRGKVNIGDYIIGSQLNDGFGIAVSPEEITLEQYKRIVGVAWSASATSGSAMVNVAIGLNNNDAVNKIQQQQSELNAVKSQLNTIVAYLKANDSSFEATPFDQVEENSDVALFPNSENVQSLKKETTGNDYIDQLIPYLESDLAMVKQVQADAKKILDKKGINYNQFEQTSRMVNDPQYFLAILKEF